MITTLAGAAILLDIGRQAVYNAIKKNRLRAIKNGGQWAFTLEDIKQYKQNRFDRKFSTYNGEPLYDKTKGEYSLTEASKILKCPEQHLYYACRTNKIHATKKRCAWIINASDIEEYKKVMQLAKKKVR